MAYVRPGPRPIRTRDLGPTVLAITVLLLVMGSIVLTTLFLAGYLSPGPGMAVSAGVGSRLDGRGRVGIASSGQLSTVARSVVKTMREAGQ